MKKKIIFFVSAIILLSSYANATEQITLTTYYPSPFGAYDRLRLLPRPELTETPCHLGLMYFRDADNRLQICEADSAGNPFWGPLGVWVQEGNDIFPKEGTRPNVGIGTTSPDAKLDVDGDSILRGRVAIGGTRSGTFSEYFKSGATLYVDQAMDDPDMDGTTYLGYSAYFSGIVGFGWTGAYYGGSDLGGSGRIMIGDHIDSGLWADVPSASMAAVVGVGGDKGVWGIANGISGFGVAGTGTTVGVVGYSETGVGVDGKGETGPGVVGSSLSGPGVLGQVGFGDEHAYSGNVGVVGVSSNIGVKGISSGNTGVYAQGLQYGIHAIASGYAGFFDGDVLIGTDDNPTSLKVAGTALVTKQLTVSERVIAWGDRDLAREIDDLDDKIDDKCFSESTIKKWISDAIAAHAAP